MGMMPDKQPVILIFEQHSFSSGSILAEHLIKEDWCDNVGFELSKSWNSDDFIRFYEEKKSKHSFSSEAAASEVLKQSIESKIPFPITLSVGSYLAAIARLRLLQTIKESSASLCGLDITMEERARCQRGLTATDPVEHTMQLAKVRNVQITESIASNGNRAVCILGILHAHDIIHALKKRKIPFIACFVRDFWARDDYINEINKVYSPSQRAADGLHQFTSVKVAMNFLRNQLIPFSLASSKGLITPTQLTRGLIKTTGLSFFSVKSEGACVSALVEIKKPSDEEKAKSLAKTLCSGSFFTFENQNYFGLYAINQSGTSDLPQKISQLILKTL